ncbi:MAG TPA: tRNA pseudouridine(38-40) synthase TruA [Clostridiales bacterium]|nr:MAG: tRNA pseudouridine(38-40) synthase TruA [Clostridiales bacterium GWD2_32_59]HAN10481.1 tRNA pseudouridine(38-40) synthase TruA [Clostridiales bacterium]
MNNYRLQIQYDGGKYKGWQRLGDNDNTIQAKIEHILSEMLARKIEIIGASRTDAGVHALAQIANFKVAEKLDPDKVKTYLNKYLSMDICVNGVDEVSENFHSRFNVKNKTYLYKIWNKECSNPFARKYSMYVKEKLDLEKIILATKYFIGEHDFTAFTNAKSKTKSKVRTIESISVNEVDGFIEIRLRGDGFLHNMARRIVGTLIEIGIGRKKVEDISKIFESGKRDQTGDMADACGLYLEKIRY